MCDSPSLWDIIPKGDPNATMDKLLGSLLLPEASGTRQAPNRVSHFSRTYGSIFKLILLFINFFKFLESHMCSCCFVVPGVKMCSEEGSKLQ